MGWGDFKSNILQLHSRHIVMMIRTDQYVSMEEEEFKLSEDDIKWLLSHTEYDDKELNTMLAGGILIILEIMMR